MVDENIPYGRMSDYHQGTNNFMLQQDLDRVRRYSRMEIRYISYSVKYARRFVLFSGILLIFRQCCFFFSGILFIFRQCCFSGNKASAIEVIMKSIWENNMYQTTTKHNNTRTICEITPISSYLMGRMWIFLNKFIPVWWAGVRLAVLYLFHSATGKLSERSAIKTGDALISHGQYKIDMRLLCLRTHQPSIPVIRIYSYQWCCIYYIWYSWLFY